MKYNLDIEPENAEPDFMIDFEGAFCDQAQVNEIVLKDALALIKRYKLRLDKKMLSALNNDPQSWVPWLAIRNLLNAKKFFTYSSDTRFSVYLKV